MTRPTTSSIIAALLSTTPRRDVVSPLVPSTVKVVPRLVEHRAAPAAKHWRGVALMRLPRTKDKPTGRPMPVTATADDRSRLALRELRDVDKPPIQSQQSNWAEIRGPTFIDQQKKAKIAKIDDDGLGIDTKPFGTRCTPGYTQENLAKKTTVHDFV
jgi:hypothetical protein